MGRPMLLAVALGLALSGCRAEPQTPIGNASGPVPAPAASNLEVIPLVIESGAGRHDFTVEVARTAEEQARGLMFRERLAPNHGMLFPFDPPRPASFWMKNTLIPLDMIFVRADGSIARIAANTVPHSLAPIGVGEPVVAVLEIGGGRAASLGIEEGGRVSWAGGPRG